MNNITQFRPGCANYGCVKPVARIATSTTGIHKYRPVCGHCHKASYGGGKWAVGVTPVKKDFCENIDGRLGFTCTTTVINGCQLDNDHINGDHANNDSSNFQTLCKCCHAMKSKMEKDCNGTKKTANWQSRIAQKT